MQYIRRLGKIEVGIDEAGRGCLAGPIFSAAVIWDPEIKIEGLKDSKRLTEKKRYELRDFIEKNAIDYAVTMVDNNFIDANHIGIANMKAMHDALDKIKRPYDFVLVDGCYFKPYKDYEHECIKQGDNKFAPIACASILAKTYRDDYIKNLVNTIPELEVYDWKNNMTYGTKKHIDAIKKYGITKYHRKSFGICNTAKMREDIP